MILKVLITVIFVGTALLKLSGKPAADWQRWGYPRLFMYATAVAEVVALGLFWRPGLQRLAVATLGLILVGALATLVRHRDGLSHVAFTALTLLLVIAQSYRSFVA